MGLFIAFYLQLPTSTRRLYNTTEPFLYSFLFFAQGLVKVWDGRASCARACGLFRECARFRLVVMPTLRPKLFASGGFAQK